MLVIHTQGWKITGGIFRVIKRDKGHDRGADNGECRNSSAETRGRVAFFRPRKAGRAQQELKDSEDTTAAVLEFWKAEPITIL